MPDDPEVKIAAGTVYGGDEAGESAALLVAYETVETALSMAHVFSALAMVHRGMPWSVEPLDDGAWVVRLVGISEPLLEMDAVAAGCMPQFLAAWKARGYFLVVFGTGGDRSFRGVATFRVEAERGRVVEEPWLVEPLH